MATTGYPHIDTSGHTPRIAGTGFKVVLLVADHLVYRWDAEQLHRQYPELTLGQIHSALAYYYDHQAELDQELEARSRQADEFRDQLAGTELQTRLRILSSRQHDTPPS
ncbi:MAG: DUF433 domain-containing protein [Pirellulales bacterium]